MFRLSSKFIVLFLVTFGSYANSSAEGEFLIINKKIITNFKEQDLKHLYQLNRQTMEMPDFKARASALGIMYEDGYASLPSMSISGNSQNDLNCYRCALKKTKFMNIESCTAFGYKWGAKNLDEIQKQCD